MENLRKQTSIAWGCMALSTSKLEEFPAPSDNASEFAVSFWKIEAGVSAHQLEEYQFAEKPAGNKFFLSHEGDIVFLILENPKNNCL